MYYKIDGQPLEEGFEHPHDVKPKGPKPSKFPVWLLILLIGLILAAGLWFLMHLKQRRKGSSFGFQFY